MITMDVGDTTMTESRATELTIIGAMAATSKTQNPIIGFRKEKRSMTNATGRVLEVGRITTTSGDDTDTYENAIVVTFADRDELYRALKSKQCGLEWLSDEEWALLAEREKEVNHED